LAESSRLTAEVFDIVKTNEPINCQMTKTIRTSTLIRVQKLNIISESFQSEIIDDVLHNILSDSAKDLVQICQSTSSSYGDHSVLCKHDIQPPLLSTIPEKVAHRHGIICFARNII
jgi:hypothetical protein